MIWGKGSDDLGEGQITWEKDSDDLEEGAVMIWGRVVMTWDAAAKEAAQCSAERPKVSILLCCSSSALQQGSAASGGLSELQPIAPLQQERLC